MAKATSTTAHGANVATLLHGYVPVVDLGLTQPRRPDHRAAVVAALREACETSGFLVAVGHGVPDTTVSAMYDAVRAFFRQSEEMKAAVANDPRDPLQHGFGNNERIQMFTASRLGELPKGESIDGEAFPGLDSPNRWPAMPDFRSAYMEYYAALSALSLEIMRLFAIALNLPEKWFDDKFDRHMTPLSANYYPPRPIAANNTLRNPEHTDFGSVTVLYQDDAPGGLQVRDETGAWLDVPPVAGSFVINLGRLMTRWTNGRWASTVHRVVNPPKEQAHLDRVSIAFFYHANPDAVISCIPTCTDPEDPPRHPPIRSGDYFLAMSRRAYVLRSMGKLD